MLLLHYQKWISERAKWLMFQTILLKFVAHPSLTDSKNNLKGSFNYLIFFFYTVIFNYVFLCRHLFLGIFNCNSGLGVLFLDFFPKAFYIILLLNVCCHSALEGEILGMPWWIKLSQEVNVSLNTACCFHYRWGNLPLMPGKKKDIIKFPICPHSLISDSDWYFLGAGGHLLYLQRLCLQLVAEVSARVSRDFSQWSSAAKRRQSLLQ